MTPARPPGAARGATNTETDRVVDTFELKKAGLKATLPRLRILEILEKGGDRHMSAEDVYRALLDAGEDVGLATIYRVLTQFETAGIVERHNFDGSHSVFEIARGPHHDHMVCLDTGDVVEFFDEEIERRQREIVAAHGFDLEDHSLVLYVRRKKEGGDGRR
jgi:Fur family transcriptional regulator, ferric uptake regulator